MMAEQMDLAGVGAYTAISLGLATHRTDSVACVWEGDEGPAQPWLGAIPGRDPTWVVYGTARRRAGQRRSFSAVLRDVEEIDEIKLSARPPTLHSVESGNVVGRKRLPSGDFYQSETESFSSFGGAVAAPDDFGADEGVVTGEIKVEVVGFVEVAEGADDGAGLGGGTEAGAEGGEEGRADARAR